MSLKYVCAYLMSALANNDQPTKDHVVKILDSVGADVDDTIVSQIFKGMEGKTVHEVITSGLALLKTVQGGSAPAQGAVAQSAATQDNQKAASKEEAKAEPEEESDEDMGFSLFD